MRVDDEHHLELASAAAARRAPCRTASSLRGEPSVPISTRASGADPFVNDRLSRRVGHELDTSNGGVTSSVR